MIKKLLFTLGLMLLPFSALAEPLAFSHASVTVYCETFDDAKIVFEVALKVQPQSFPATCRVNRRFGSKIQDSAQPYLTQVSASLRDWEGDLMAIFEYELGGYESIWLIIYNPDSLKGQEVQRNYG